MRCESIIHRAADCYLNIDTSLSCAFPPQSTNRTTSQPTSQRYLLYYICCTTTDNKSRGTSVRDLTPSARSARTAQTAHIIIPSSMRAGTHTLTGKKSVDNLRRIVIHRQPTPINQTSCPSIIKSCPHTHTPHRPPTDDQLVHAYRSSAPCVHNPSMCVCI